MNKLLSSFLVTALTVPATAALADNVTFGSRNFMEGELKHMERGRLYFKTQATDTIYIDWEDVASVTSQQTLEVKLQSGRLLYGSLEPTENKGQVVLRQETDSVVITLEEIVRIEPIKDDFFSRFDGSINAGLNATKANSYRQFTLGLDLEYVTRRYERTITASSINTKGEDSDASSQSQLVFENNRKLPNRWHTGALLGFERNEDLGIDLRSSLGWGVGRSVLQSNLQTLVVEGGLLLSREDVTDSEDNLSNSEDNENNIESFGSVSYEVFRYHEPEVDLTTKLQIIPSLSDWGRVRGQFSITLNWEIIGDLSWQLSLLDNYDSAPPGDATSKNDYSVVTGVSWDI